MMHPRPDLLDHLLEADAVVDAFGWHLALSGETVDRNLIRALRTQTRLQLLDQLAVQRALDAISEPEDQLPKRPARKVRPVAEPPH